MNTNHARSWERSSEPNEPSEPARKKQVTTVKVYRRGWVTKGEKVLYTLVSALLILAGIYIVSYSSSTDTLNRELQSLEQTVDNQFILNESLHYEVSELSRPERITRIAKDKGLKIQDTKVKRANAFNN